MFKNLTWKTWAGAEKASLRPGREPGKGQEDASRPKSEEQGAENTSSRKGGEVDGHDVEREK